MIIIARKSNDVNILHRIIEMLFESKKAYDTSPRVRHVVGLCALFREGVGEG